MQKSRPTVSVVIPVYDEEDCIAELRNRIGAVRAALPADTDILLVNDGSRDGSLEMIREWCRSDSSVRCLNLSRNFGEQAATSAGLGYATGDYVVLMHADLQDPPEMIPTMFERAMSGADVVYTRRIGRDESLLKRSLATAFYAIMERLARTPYRGQAGDFKILSRPVVDAVNEMPERRRFLRGMVAFVGFEQVPVDYQRADRSAGKGASYPFLFKLAAEAVTAYSDVPLSLATIMGSAVAALSALAGIVFGLLAILGTISASLNLLILTAVLFLGGVQLVTIGILGTYVARIHEQTLQRPLYLVKEIIGADASDQ